MKQRHHQNQREQARDPAHGPQRYSRRRDFDNACERRYFQRVPSPPKNWIEAVRFGDDGLVPVVAQSALAGEVLMVAYADREALEKTRDTGQAHYRSRSRGELWQKGATSGHTQTVQEVRVDCDGDAVLYLVRQQGPACHTGAPTCFGEATGGTLTRLARTVAERARDKPTGSYTTRLLDEGVAKIAQKVGEEAVETVVAATSEDRARLASEAADLIYHLLVLLEARQLPLDRVLEELDARAR
ncbi:MAG: bifunctional phosphoribosyl-AMP cyclohydrolase/phosphoribosyl-ATP pyrophosphatase [Gemmatimonadetes bacterium]|nr:MAG: bifunctional phosphoribosyl-AMP cyclohydrolase/phosphoribosyl-ATP pyrophosphatase [Gemmatimonadota bacterium]